MSNRDRPLCHAWFSLAPRRQRRSAYFSARQYDAAISDASLQPETRPDGPSLHDILGEEYRRKGQLKEAAQELEKFVALTDNIAAVGLQRRSEQNFEGKLILPWGVVRIGCRDGAEGCVAKRLVSGIVILYIEAGSI